MYDGSGSLVTVIKAVLLCPMKAIYECVDSQKLKAAGVDYKGELGGGNNKWSYRYKCSDGSSVFIYDLRDKAFPTGGVLPPTAVAEFNTFQIKYADMKTSEAQLDYNVYWVETFKSLDDLRTKLEAQGLTWEE